MILLVVVVSAFGARIVSLRPDVQIPDEMNDTGTWPLTEGLVPDAAVYVESSGESSGVQVDISDLALMCGEQIEEYSLTGWVWINDRETTEEELRSMVEQAVRPLESALLKSDGLIWTAGTWTSGSVEGARGVDYLRWLGNDRWVESWARSVSYRGEGPGEGGMAYLVLHFTGLTGRQMADSLNKVIKDSLHGLGEEECTSLEVICWREGGVDEEQMNSLVSQVLASAEAEEVVRSKQDDRLVVTAFSPAIPDRSEGEGSPVNLQLVARYRAQDNRTYFHLGIPLIMEDY